MAKKAKRGKRVRGSKARRVPTLDCRPLGVLPTETATSGGAWRVEVASVRDVPRVNLDALGASPEEARWLRDEVNRLRRALEAREEELDREWLRRLDEHTASHDKERQEWITRARAYAVALKHVCGDGLVVRDTPRSRVYVAYVQEALQDARRCGFLGGAS